MVSFTMDDQVQRHTKGFVLAAQRAEANRAATPTGPLDRMDDIDDAATCGSSFESAAATIKQQQQQQQRRPELDNGDETTPMSISASELAANQLQPAASDDNSSSGEPDEEQLRRILTRKRLSEGCNRFNSAGHVCRKNSLHMIGEELPPVTEGEPMRHLSHHLSQNMESLASSSSSGSSRSNRQLGGLKRNSQDENTSCSSSTSLDGPRSPGRRRSSTVSQCSSVLSEGTRQQLNFDLSPDLPPDSSLLEANAISPTDLDRPASPEPSLSLSADGSLDMRPVSRLSHDGDDFPLGASPDSTLGASNSNLENHHQVMSAQLASITHSVCGPTSNTDQTPSETSRPLEGGGGGDDDDNGDDDDEILVRENLERLISHVSTVKVSSDEAGGGARGCHQVRKRAHTPCQASAQRNKSSMLKPSPAREDSAGRC